MAYRRSTPEETKAMFGGGRIFFGDSLRPRSPKKLPEPPPPEEKVDKLVDKKAP